MIKGLAVVFVLLFASLANAQTTVILGDCRVTGLPKPYADGDFRLTVRCEKNGNQKPVVGDKAQILRPVVVQPPVNCAGTWSAWVPAGDWSACNGGTQTRPESRAFTVTTPASNGGLACPASPETRTASQSCTVPPPTGEPLFGVSDPAILGDFTAAEHDAYSVSMGDGYRYRTWHPQCVGTKCFAHEHGDNPAQITNPEIVASLKTAPLAFGYIGRRMQHLPGEANGHEEPNEGFKVFTAKIGECNDEARCNLTESLSVFHMGTGGPRRGATRFHSNDLRYWNVDSGFVHTRLMMDTGGVDNVCDPRGGEPVKDMFTLPNRCKVNSGYEIWTTSQYIHLADGRALGRPRAVPAVFDPITVFNPANPSEVIYAWDDRFKPYRNFPNDDWTINRGCVRESYAQVANWWNAGGPTQVYTDSMGHETSQANPLAILQTIPAKEIVDHRSSTVRPGETAGNQAFKLRKDYCGTPAQKAKLGLKN